MVSYLFVLACAAVGSTYWTAVVLAVDSAYQIGAWLNG